MNWVRFVIFLFVLAIAPAWGGALKPQIELRVGALWRTSYSTRVTLRMLGFTGDEESQKRRGFFEAGNQQTLNSLGKKFEVRP